MGMTAEEATRVAHAIALGHAYWEHATHIAESGELLSESSFESLILATLFEPAKMRKLSAGRLAFWNEGEQFLVIVNPHDPDKGTAFWPDRDVYEYKKLV